MCEIERKKKQLLFFKMPKISFWALTGDRILDLCLSMCVLYLELKESLRERLRKIKRV